MHTFSQVAGGPTITKLSFVMLEYCANLVEEAEVQAWLSVEITIGAYCNGALPCFATFHFSSNTDGVLLNHKVPTGHRDCLFIVKSYANGDPLEQDSTAWGHSIDAWRTCASVSNICTW